MVPAMEPAATMASLIQRRVEANTTCLALAVAPHPPHTTTTTTTTTTTAKKPAEFSVYLKCHVTAYTRIGQGPKVERVYRGAGADTTFVAEDAADVPSDEEGVRHVLRGMLKEIRPLQDLGLTDDEWESILPEDVVPQLADLAAARGCHRDDDGDGTCRTASVYLAVERHVSFDPVRALMAACNFRKTDEMAAEAEGEEHDDANDDNDDDEEEEECIVCFDALVGGMNGKKAVVELPGCAHAFHSGCISTWFRWNPTCPVCRGDVVKHLDPQLQQLIDDYISDASIVP